jgi:hypothetical protein
VEYLAPEGGGFGRPHPFLLEALQRFHEKNTEEQMSPNTNGNGAPKSPYTRLVDTDEAFATIEETLNGLIANKAFDKQKAALTTYLEQTVNIRHQVASLLVQKFVNYEAGQLKKLAPPTTT